MSRLNKVFEVILLMCILFPVSAKSQIFEECQQIIPPFSWDGIEVDHVLGDNVTVDSGEGPTSELCFGTGYSIHFPRLHLGSHDGFCGWNPFGYLLTFSKPINSISILLFIGNIANVETGEAEDFIFNTECSTISIQSLHSCNSIITGDTIYLGAPIDNFGTGNGWYRINFSQPVSKFTISGKGGGCGSSFKICANSLNQAPLWAGVYGPEVVCGSGSLSFERYGWLAGPYTYTYNINGGAPQTFVTNETLAEIPLSELFGGEPPPGQYTIELTEIKDGSGWPVALSCNTSHTFEVAQQPVAQFTASPSSGVAPLEVNLQNQSSNATNYAWYVNPSGGFDSAQPPVSTAENPVLNLNET